MIRLNKGSFVLDISHVVRQHELVQADAFLTIYVVSQAEDLVVFVLAAVFLEEKHIPGHAPAYKSSMKAALIDHDSIVAPHLQQVLDESLLFELVFIQTVILRYAVLVVEQLSFLDPQNDRAEDLLIALVERIHYRVELLCRNGVNACVHILLRRVQLFL